MLSQSLRDIVIDGNDSNIASDCKTSNPLPSPAHLVRTLGNETGKNEMLKILEGLYDCSTDRFEREFS